MTTSPRAARAVGILLLCLAVGQFLLQVSLLTNGVEYIASVLTNDDTYYYLQTAWNAKESGVVTFDGINRTNGVQLLWFWMVFLLSLVSRTKTDLLHASLVSCFALNVFCYVAIWRLATLVRRPALAVLMGGLWSTLVAEGTYWLALDNSLHAFVFWCIVWQTAEFFDRLHRGRRASILLLTIVLVLNAWTRLDSAICSVVIYLVCTAALLRGPENIGSLWRRKARHVGASVLIGGLGAVVALAAFYLMGGSLLPVSALVKLSWPSESAPLLKTVREAIVLGFPLVLPHRFASPLVKIALSLTSMAVVGAASPRRSGEALWPAALRRTWLVLAVAVGIYHVAGVISGAQHYEYFVWYRSPLFVFWIITLCGAACIGTTAITRTMFRTPGRGLGRRGAARDGAARGVADWAIASLGVVFIVLSIVRLLAPPSIDPTSMLAIRYRASVWMADNLPKDSTCASWNAGQLGFYSPQAVINLDGLINSVEYYENVLGGQQSLTDYLSGHNVRYIVDHQENELTAGLETIHAFPADATGRQLRVWYVPSGES